MFSRAIVRPPAANFSEGLTTSSLGTPDYERALLQHAAYCDALERSGLTLTRLEADERYPDSTFVEDTAVITNGRVEARFAILTRPGAPSRSAEVDSIAEVLSQFFPVLQSIKEPGTIDGGDVCEAGDHFFIGVSERTNEAGAEQLAKLLTRSGYTSTLIDVRGIKNLLHLKSGLAYLGDNRLVVIDELASGVGHAEAFRSYELIHVNPSEEYAANCIRVNATF